MGQLDPLDRCFLVRLTDTDFVADIDNRTITTSMILSRAAHWSFREASQWAEALKRRGHRLAIVTDYMGRPITAQALKLEADARTEAYEKSWK